jgi:CDP-diacylglycerol pyrophosphatase
MDWLKPIRAVRSLPLLAAALLLGCVSTLPSLPPPPIHPDGQTLWRIVSEQCAPNQRQHGDPAPCALVSSAGGYAVLKDRDGVAQYLVLPTDKITGIEDAKLLAADAPNYFAAAWAARSFVQARLGGAPPRDEMGVAVNSIYGRSQDQLHLHVDCLAPGVSEALRADAPRIGRQWSSRAFSIGGHAYLIRRIEGDSLAGIDPFHLLAQQIPGAAKTMGAWTLVLAGASFRDGRPGFYLLAERADPGGGEPASGEVLQDHDCKDQRAQIAPSRPVTR